MFLERIYDRDLAHASYIVGCQEVRRAIVVDPRRDIDVYVKTARENGMAIVGVTETHIHADYLSGTRELARATGATMYVSDEGGADWTYGDGFVGAIRMKDKDEISVGRVRLRAVHTPGHTPEHMSFLVTDGALSPEPGFMLTGDFVFVGDLGRPDLLDEVGSPVGAHFDGAKHLFASLKERFVTLPDYVQVLPAHGSGSPCGKALGAVPSSTVGYERRFSWWARYIEDNDEHGFVAALLTGQPDAHAYFSRMKAENRHGPVILDTKPHLKEYSTAELRRALESDEIVFVDTRAVDEVHAGTVKDSLNIPGLDKAASYGAWVYNPQVETRPLVLLAEDADRARAFRNHLVRVGVDAVAGFITSLEGLDLVEPKTVSVEEFPNFDHMLLLDVRNKSEFADGHLPGAAQLSAGRALWQTENLPSDGPIVTYCQSGIRSSVISSALRRAGFDIAELKGSYKAWVKAGHSPSF